MFNATYLSHAHSLRYGTHHLYEQGTSQGIRLLVEHNGRSQWVNGEGNGPIDAAVKALHSMGVEIQVRSYEERSMSASQTGGNAKACAFVEVASSTSANRSDYFGVGIDENIITASIKALISGVNRIGVQIPALEQAA